MPVPRVEAPQPLQSYVHRFHKMVQPYKRCWHYVPADLAHHLPHRSVCPACTIERHIRGARRIDSEFAKRDGIFQSKAAGRRENEAIGSPNSPEWRKHRKLVERWRRARVEMRRDVSRLEELIEGASFKDCAECSKILRNALSMYEQWAMHEHEPPGCRDEPNRSQDGETPVEQNAPGLEPSSVELCSRSSSSSIDSRKSCLKKSTAASDDGPTPPPSPKNVVIDEHAQVFPSPSKVAGSDEALNEDTAEEPHRRPHSAQSSRETARPKIAIRRSLSVYTRGSWASPEGYTKEETSFMTIPWDDLETIWARDKANELDGADVTEANEGRSETSKDVAENPATTQHVAERKESQALYVQQCGVLSWSERMCKRAWGILKKI
ncbi:hypothetical protein BDV96DRAFT_602606 [Lophiotrema nucula]|uniref:Uncharacterized protein n=1 Tax=Lophiotrema nucula TaxID=690887 RepID=A0A6A5Z190_9PLEO|nr:hypothetical protein BDV96DRAFT_602606 [Lophiotrema nucula]